MNTIVKYPLQQRLEITTWIILAVLFVVSFIFTAHAFYLGVLLGGFISILNFHGMEMGLRHSETIRKCSCFSVKHYLVWR